MNLGLLLKQLMGPQQQGFQPVSGNLMDAMQQVQSPSGAGTPGELRRGPDGKTYQYAQTTGMAGASGDQGWIEANPDAFGKSSLRSGLADLLDSRVALPMAAGLLKGSTPMESFGNAFEAGGPALGKLHDEKRANDYLGKNFPDLAQMVNAGMPVDAAWSAALKKKNATSDVTYGMTPQWGLDDQGKPVMGVVGNDGTFKKIDTPGFNISKTPIKMDAGTHWVLLDPVTRQPIAEIPKDLAGAEAQKKAGELTGAAQFDLPRVVQNAEQTLGVLERMKTHPGREGSTGFIEGVMPSRTSAQVDFQSLVDQTQGQSFLQAFQMLKGGGQITEIEGAKATAAISRLGNQRLSDADYLRAIDDLEEVINAGLARARAQAGTGGGAPDASGGVPDYKGKYGLD